MRSSSSACSSGGYPTSSQGGVGTRDSGVPSNKLLQAIRISTALGDDGLCDDPDDEDAVDPFGVGAFDMNTNQAWASSHLADLPPDQSSSPCAFDLEGGRLCRMGCGREVQPGLTRTMKRFDTCCKRCVTTGGRGHDANCGKIRDSSGGEVDIHRWHEWRSKVETLHKDDDLLRSVVEEVLDGVLGSRGSGSHGAFSNFTAAFTGGSKSSKDSGILSTAQVSRGIYDFIIQLAPLEAKRCSKEPMLTELMSNFDKKCTGRLRKEKFFDLCKLLFNRLHEEWFPPKLPLSTRNFVQRNPRLVQEVYQVTTRLGHGSYGVVHAAEHRISGTRRVCKLIQKRTMAGDVSTIMQEIRSMAMLDHPNVVKVYEYFDDDDYVSQIIEQCSGGELKARIEAFHKRGESPYSEAFMKDVMKQTMRALAFMHSKRFAHKDLKPENIMMVEKDSAASSSSIKIIDFGLAEHFNPHSDRSEMVGGTLLFMPPEVFLTGEMTMKCDIWSAGVVLYNLITGTYPYTGTWPPADGKQDTWEEETADRIVSAPMADNSRLRSVSQECTEILRYILQKEESRRPDATMCLDHVWYQQKDDSMDAATLSVGTVQCVEAYARMSELKKAIFLLMAHQSAVPAVGELRQIFTHFDVGNRGLLTTQDLRLVLARAGTPCLSAERIVHALDREWQGTIGWTEFLSAVLCISICHDTKLVDSAFATFDRNQDGKIYVEDLQKVLGGTSGYEAWGERLPALFLEMIPKDFRPKEGSRQKKLWVNKDQFRAYVGQHTQIRMPGDKIYAVG